MKQNCYNLKVEKLKKTNLAAEHLSIDLFLSCKGAIATSPKKKTYHRNLLLSADRLTTLQAKEFRFTLSSVSFIVNLIWKGCLLTLT